VIKTIIKLAVAALVAHAVWQLFVVYSAHYRFKDSVTSTTQFRGQMTDAQLHDRIFELASQFDVPVTDESLTIRQQENHTIVESSYTRPVNLFPGFTYPWPFSLKVDTFSLAGATKPDSGG
jgi:hypothetical protein